MPENEKPKLNLTTDDMIRCYDACNGKVTEWSEAKMPDEAKRPWILAYDGTRRKIEAYLNATQPKSEDK